MEKKQKFEPKDSNQLHRKDGQTVETNTRKSQDHHHQESKTNEPALKRKFNEQPPTKHNSKT